MILKHCKVRNLFFQGIIIFLLQVISQLSWHHLQLLGLGVPNAHDFESHLFEMPYAHSLPADHVLSGSIQMIRRIYDDNHTPTVLGIGRPAEFVQAFGN